MTKFTKGDRVWVAGPVDYPEKRLTVEQVTIKSTSGAHIIVHESSRAADNRVKLLADRVSFDREEAVLYARGVLRTAAAKLEEEARRLRASADAEPEVVPSEP